MGKSLPPPKPRESSTFAERFLFGRAWQELHGVPESDEEFAAAVGRSASSVSLYKKQEAAPPVATVQPMAARMGLDAGWLAFGGKAAEPEGFADWLERYRAAIRARAKYKTSPHADEQRKKGRG